MARKTKETTRTKGDYATKGGKHNLLFAKCPYCNTTNTAEDGHLYPQEIKTCPHLQSITRDNTFIFARKGN